jgi:hypothetical protein
MFTHLIGFTSLKDFFNTISGYKSIKLNFIIAFLFGVSTFIQNWIYNSAPAIYFMTALLFFDLITGVIRAFKQRNFTSAKLPRAFVVLLTYCILLSISTQASIYSPYFTFLPGVVYGGILSTLIVSLMENLYQAGFIKKNIYDLILTKINQKTDEI